MELGRTFAALADPTRRDLLDRLAGGEARLSELAEPLPMSLMGVQKHVRVLEDAGLVATRKVGRSRLVRLNPPALRHAADWLERAEARWNAAFDRLAQALEEEEP